MGQDMTTALNLPKRQLHLLVERRGDVTCLWLILGEMQAAQLLHPHVGVPQLRHVVTQGHDAVETTRKGCVTPECSLAPTSQLEGTWPGEPT